MERLQKALAAAGVASRRACEELITAGRVSVNGRVVTTLGTSVADDDLLVVDGKPVARSARRTYLMLHKPAGYVTTADDPQGRPTVLDLVRPSAGRRRRAAGWTRASSPWAGWMLTARGWFSSPTTASSPSA